MKTILHITPFFAPNIGGVETHLSDLVNTLGSQGYRVYVLTYTPLSTPAKAPHVEKSGNIYIRRFRWPGYNLFHRLEKYPALNFLYLTPYLLIRSFLWLLVNRIKFDAVHTHGLNAALIGNIQKHLGIKKHIVSIYSSYDNVPFSSFSTRLLVRTLNRSDAVLTQSDKSVAQLKSLGVNADKLHRYYHWIDLNTFAPIKRTRSKLSTIQFIGRLIPVKNALTLARLASKFPDLHFRFVGTGPDFEALSSLASKYKNIETVGDVPYSKLNYYYQTADLLCVPSRYEEGWGRVIAESVACGTPVITSNRGATTEAADELVAIFINPTSKNLFAAIKKLATSPALLSKMSSHCRPYALKHYSSKNISYITRHY